MMTSIVKQQSLTMLLRDVVAPEVELQECMISDISMDSRRVAPGGLFLSVARQAEEREKHLQQALDKGAFAVLIDTEQRLTEHEQAMLDEAVVSAYPVENLSHQAGAIAARFYDHPSTLMTVIAVTGTNGKTSVTQFIAQALEGIGKPCGVIGTLGAGRISDLELTGMTTPDPVSMQRLLAGFQLEGCRFVVMEASSHALEQGRLNSIDINIGVLTNLSRDHLDYHQTMADYAAAKKRLFDFASLNTAVINSSDDLGRELAPSLDSNKALRVLRYSAAERADIYARAIDCQRDGMSFETVIGHAKLQVRLPLLGLFNVDNMLATIGVLYALDLNTQQIEKAITHCHAVSGRMEGYGGDLQPSVVIDYAHTPDALEQALKTLRMHLPENGHLWCVFGCGGDRDKGKRPLMGRVAENGADKVIITDDNPRTENHDAIISDILAGCMRPENIRVEHDRKSAITYAVTHADKWDIVLVAGKGHESYQEINHIKYPFSDAHIVSELLASMQHDVFNVAGGH